MTIPEFMDKLNKWTSDYPQVKWYLDYNVTRADDVNIRCEVDNQVCCPISVLGKQGPSHVIYYDEIALQLGINELDKKIIVSSADGYNFSDEIGKPITAFLDSQFYREDIRNQILDRTIRKNPA